MNRSLVLGLIVLLSLPAAGWAGGKRYGQPIDPKVSVVKLKDVTGSPAAYQDKDVVLDGMYGFYCCPGDFSYKEGLETIAVSPAGFASPKGKPGQPVRIYGTVKIGKRPEEERERQNEGSEEASSDGDVYLEAKGVEFR